MIFDYPVERQTRRHGPAGYTSYGQFRAWLRDEFTFRCIYCLKRETWGQVTGDYELDHFEPQSSNPELRLDYENLVYACRRCNLTKSAQKIENPLTLLCSERVSTLEDGTLETPDIETKRLILQLDLNSSNLKNWRILWMRIVELAERNNPELYDQIAGFPDLLPDLSTLRPPVNHRIEGINESWFARRERDELPRTY
ncbi:HNH endonuclease [Gimesia fumaroli]|uniref:HNH endonuclease n=1 Tax=Gimesia fumaroli TaxID=2527976 RepID=A0A518IFC2_9PLAN|nr:HNH endonuclease signature motif containing protein [Gimesia fumaroli]QDV51785.1 HNH endonuclease [Gimesia fumaroli]